MVDCSMKCERFLVFALVSLWSSWYPRTEAVDGTCGADFSSTARSEQISAGMQVVLLPGFEGCGRLLRCTVTAMCQKQGQQECSIDFQLWRRTETGLFTLVNSNSTARNPESNPLEQEMLSFPLDMEFTVGDMVGFYLDQPNPLNVHTAAAGNRSYLLWSSMPKSSSTLNSVDATTIMSHLPILNVEGTCHPCPSPPQTMSISEQMSSSPADDATTSDGLPTSAIYTSTSSGGEVSSTSNGDSTTTVTAGTTSAASSAQPSSSLPESVHLTSSPPATYQTSSTGPPETDTSNTAFSQSGSSAGFSLPSSPSSLPAPLTSSSAATSIVPTTGGQEESGASAGVAAGVAVGLVLAVVVVVVVVAIVLVVVCSIRRRKKYDLSGIVTYEVPPDTHIAANCCAEAAPYEMIPLSNGKGSPDGVYDVPCDMDEPKYSDGPFAYDVPSSSTLPLVYDTVSDDTAAENIILQEKPYYNMGCHGNGVLPTDGSEHEYQEADTVPQRTRPLLEESVEQETFPIYGFVPTVGERSRLTLDESTEYELLQESHADQATETSAYYNNPSCVPRLEEQRGDTLASISSNVVDGVYETSSTDEDIYWSPSSKEEEIYAQMSRRKYQEIPRDKVKMLTKLGEGEFGEVYKAVLKTPTGTSQDVAVKVVKKGAPQEERLKLLQEAAILGQFRHRHVVSLFGVVTLGDPKMMVMELLPGDLKSHLGQISETASLRSDPDLPSLLLQFCKQVVDGLVCLAGKSFVHRDIAARNILLDKELNCKISDFGMTREVESETYYMLGKGAKIPVKWTAPEAILYKKYTTKSDIWSYGMLMYEIWSLGHKPFESNTVQEMVRLLDAHYCLPPPPGCPREVYSVMVDCWNPAHNERPTAADILGNFCKSERVLLAWRSEDPVPALSRTLGAPLSEGETLHRDLQNKYKDSLVKQ